MYIYLIIYILTFYLFTYLLIFYILIFTYLRIYILLSSSFQKMYTVLILCMSTFLSFNHFACARSPIPDSVEYGIIVDAGSSSSKLKVYSWERGAHAMSANGTNPATQQHDLKLIHVVKFSPGVSSLVYALDKVPGYMNPILQEAKARIPIYKHATTSIQFMATAGEVL